MKSINIEELQDKQVYGFKFKHSEIYYNSIMDAHIGEIGVITDIKESRTVIQFKDEWWEYPTDLIKEHLVDQEISYYSIY